MLICDHGTLSDGHLISLRLRAPKGLVPCLLKHWSAGVRDFWGGVSGKTHLYLLITKVRFFGGVLVVRHLSIYLANSSPYYLVDLANTIYLFQGLSHAYISSHMINDRD